MSELRENVILGALLHDIGKFWQRAEPYGSLDKSTFLENSTKSIIGDFCPKYKQNYSHKHSAWTYQFFVSFEMWCYNNGLSGEDSVINIAAKHHNPTTVIQEIIQKADWISAGMDRSTGEDLDSEISEESKRRYNFRKQRLKPVFESLFANDYDNYKKNSLETLRYNLNPLDLSDTSLFPKNYTGEDVSLDEEFRDNLWNGFEQALPKLPKSDFQSYLESMLSLLWKYTWCIPSSTIDIPDISLYDHLRSTSAVALCIYDYINEKQPAELSKNKANSPIIRKIFDDPDEKFTTLICGDISGIQSFIYQITSSKASVSLKGRSFMIQLLSDACARYILQEMNLPYTNLIYSSGGNFYIIAPNTKFSKEKLSGVKNKINRGLLKKYKGKIYLAIGSQELSATDFLNNLHSKWENVIQDAREKKNRRFISEIKNSEFFKPFGPVEKVKPCNICGNDLQVENENDSEIICSDCKELIELGKRLKNAQYIIEAHSEDLKFKPVPGIQISYEIADKSNLQSKLQKTGGLFTKVWRLNNTDFLPYDEKSLSVKAYGFKFYGGNQMPLLENGNVATFNDLAGEKHGSLKRLGVLRMDVDNLGFLFQRGFTAGSINDKPSESTGLYSLSRLSTLSSMLDIFFSGYLNNLARQKKYEDKLMVIYSGGDDIFMVGRWDHLVNCAMEIRQTFVQYCCGNPHITLSGGMVMTPQKFPIHRSADMAGEAEEKAKSYRYILKEEPVIEKNAFTFLEKTLDWHDLEIACEMKQDLVDSIAGTEEGLNRGILTRLRRIHENYLNEKKIIESNKTLSKDQREELVQYNKWRWRMVYDLTRFIQQNKKHGKLITNFQNALLSGYEYKNRKSHQNIQEFIDIPTRWAELCLRQLRKEK